MKKTNIKFLSFLALFISLGLLLFQNCTAGSFEKGDSPTTNKSGGNGDPYGGLVAKKFVMIEPGYTCALLPGEPKFKSYFEVAPMGKIKFTPDGCFPDIVVDLDLPIFNADLTYAMLDGFDFFFRLPELNMLPDDKSLRAKEVFCEAEEVISATQTAFYQFNVEVSYALRHAIYNRTVKETSTGNIISVDEISDNATLADEKSVKSWLMVNNSISLKATAEVSQKAFPGIISIGEPVTKEIKVNCRLP